ncbi:MAG TPA: carboxypeptidase-like regulatory domain-containing protein [Bacteroidales bacterium]|nr:carboxypeptidase-like regulatory domain-containing protein [Bacteroidales bacterium]
MKTLRIAVVLIIAAFSTYMLTSCDPESAEPTITWEGIISYNYDANEDGNYAHTLNLVVDAEAGINLFNIWKHVITDTDTVSSLVDSPADCIGLLTYNHDLDIAVTPADVAGGVTKIIYEFEVTDNDLNTVTEEFVIFVTNGTLSYNVTFIVKDGAGADITDAIMVFGDSTNTAGDYTLVNVPAGTYNYTVNKTGYDEKAGTGFVLASDTTVTIELQQVWSAEVPLALYLQTTWATYLGNPVTTYYSEVFGIAFDYTDANTVRIIDTKHDGSTLGCDGWVVVTDITNLTSQNALSTAYAAGNVIHTYDLPYDQHVKTYDIRYLISKMGTTYKLVKYVAGYRDADTGNIVVFQYKY